MNDTQVEQEIQAKGLTAPRVTPELIDALMARTTFLAYVPPDTTSTFVHIYLDGNFLLATGFSACVSVENFDAEMGERIARADAVEKARNKLWELEGYSLYKAMSV